MPSAPFRGRVSSSPADSLSSSSRWCGSGPGRRGPSWGRRSGFLLERRRGRSTSRPPAWSTSCREVWCGALLLGCWIPSCCSASGRSRWSVLGRHSEVWVRSSSSPGPRVWCVGSRGRRGDVLEGKRRRAHDLPPSSFLSRRRGRWRSRWASRSPSSPACGRLRRSGRRAQRGGAPPPQSLWW